jgi:hypothetical protein
MKPSCHQLLLTGAIVAATGCAHSNLAGQRKAAGAAAGAHRVIDARLFYDRAAPTNAPGPLADGELIGSGGGDVTGALRGSLRWSLYERNSGNETGPARCTMYFVGTVQTDDGDTIPFEGRGYAVSRSDTWSVAGAFSFRPPDSQKYAWLREAALGWLGEFDPNASSHHYAIYELSKSPEGAE